MLREYLDEIYLPASQSLNDRLANGAEWAKTMVEWEKRVRVSWQSVSIGYPDITQDGDEWIYAVPVHFGEMNPDDIAVELYADPYNEQDGLRRTLTLSKGASAAGYIYTGRVPASRPTDHYTVRVLPYHPDVRIPLELPLIGWQK
jgi:starch phosphorylase